MAYGSPRLQRGYAGSGSSSGRHEIRVLLFVVHYLVGRRSFERSRGLCFSALVTPLNRQWLRKSA